MNPSGKLWWAILGLVWMGLMIGGVALLAPRVVDFKPTRLCQRICDSFISEDVSTIGLEAHDQCFCRIESNR